MKFRNIAPLPDMYTPEYLSPMRHDFEYKGKQYSGEIISSTDKEPHFYWFCFLDRELVELIADSIAFRRVNGRLEPVHHYINYKDLVEQLRRAVENYISSVKSR